MKFKILIFIIAYSFVFSAWPQSPFRQLSQQSASRLDLALMRMVQDALRFEIKNRENRSNSLFIEFATARFNNKSQQVELILSIKGKPSKRLCEMGIKRFMFHMNFFYDSDDSGAVFYSSYFMPSDSPRLSYEEDAYKTVYMNTVFETHIQESSDGAAHTCRYRGGMSEITHRTMR